MRIKISISGAMTLPLLLATACGDGGKGEPDVGDVADEDVVDSTAEADVPQDTGQDSEEDTEADAVELPPGLVWVSIPAGEFDMGCQSWDPDCQGAATPMHTVSVPAFEMAETEITQGQYEWLTGSNPSDFASCGANCPVEQVDWYEARAFCSAIGGRLASEAEWEYAARAGTTSDYYCGEGTCLDGIAWFRDNSLETTHPVGGKEPNAFGLFDMLGNVEEWVEDSWHPDYAGAPTDGSVWSGGEVGFRVARGGTWHDGYDWEDPWASTLYRLFIWYRFAPEADVVGPWRGFRCAR